MGCNTSNSSNSNSVKYISLAENNEQISNKQTSKKTANSINQTNDADAESTLSKSNSNSEPSELQVSQPIELV